MAYVDHEQEFLEAIAEQWFVALQDRFLFVQRHLEQNLGKSHKEIASKYKADLNHFFAVEDLCQAIRERLSDNVYPVLKDHGLVLNFSSKKFWLQSQQWLKQEIYPQWLQSQGETLWRKLWQRGEFTDKIYPERYELKLSNLAPSPSKPRKLSQVAVGTDIIYRVDEPLKGYLLWLERDSEGGIYCFSPSYLAPSPVLDGRSFVFPQPDSESPSLEIGEDLGEEQVLVITVPSRPNWDWLPDEQGDPLQLEPQHLDLLLDQVRVAGVQMKRACYEVVAAEPKQ
jgi:hypothetical protein